MDRQQSTFARPAVPFLGIVALAFASTGLGTAGTDWTLVAVAAVGSAVLGLAAWVLPWSRLPLTWLLVLPFAVDGVLALLRQAQGGSTSGYSPLAILPVAWVGLTQRRRAVAAISGCTALLFALPIVLIGAPLYPSTGWRSVVLWTAAAVAVGIGANRVVTEQRRLAALAGVRALAFDMLVDVQTEIATANFDLDGVMTGAAEGALRLTGAEGACIELLDGDEVVCSAAAGVAVEFLGLRLKAEDSITGECFRTGQILICSDSETDLRVAREACQLVGARSLILVPLLHGGQTKGVLIVWSAAVHAFQGHESQLLALLANTIGAAFVRGELIAKLTEQAVNDELTGLPNRRAWYEQLERALARARRTGEPLSVLALDLDGFKQVNDRQGHAAGDRLLEAVSRSWSDALRTTDLLGRIGGDEFAVILELTDEAAALEVVVRLERSLPPRQRVSTGLAVWDGREDAAGIVARADAHMYERKRATAARAARSAFDEVPVPAARLAEGP